MHVWSGNYIAGVNHNGQYQDGRHGQSLRDSSCKCGNCPEQCRHYEPDHHGKEEESEELRWLLVKPCEKVQDKIEADSNDELDRRIRNHTCQSVGKRVVKTTEKISIEWR